MKKVVFTLAVALSVILSACTKLENKERAVSTPVEEETKIAAADTRGPDQFIAVGKETFSEMVDYIERHGDISHEGGVPCDRRFTLIDSDGNSHSLVTIKRDANQRPSNDGLIRQISVWAYYNQRRDNEHFFSYKITEKGVSFLAAEPKDVAAIEKAYKEFMDLVHRTDYTL